MTQFSDQIRLGRAYFARQSYWNTTSPINGFPVAGAPQDTQVLGVPFTQTFVYQMGTASTALASGVYYSASGTSTTGGTTLTATGALVSGGVATFDIPRSIRITSSVNLSTTTFVFAGTDGYGQAQTYSRVGPTGNTFGNAGSYVDTLVTWKTASSITMSNLAASGTSTTALAIGTNDTYGLPYVLGNLGMGLDVFINGSSASVAATWVAAYTPTGTPTATTGDVRGTVSLATTSLADGSKYITCMMVAPAVNLTDTTDNRVRSYGAIPYTV